MEHFISAVNEHKECRESAVHDRPKPTQKHTQLSLSTKSQKILRYHTSLPHNPSWCEIVKLIRDAVLAVRLEYCVQYCTVNTARNTHYPERFATLLSRDHV